MALVQTGAKRYRACRHLRIRITDARRRRASHRRQVVGAAGPDVERDRVDGWSAVDKRFVDDKGGVECHRKAIVVLAHRRSRVGRCLDIVIRLRQY